MTMTGVRPALTGCARIRAIDMKLEVVVIPVSDVDRAKAFYTKLGWRLDADFASGADRVIQFTPDLLRETETRHGRYEPSAPKHHWSSWYAAYSSRASAEKRRTMPQRTRYAKPNARSSDNPGGPHGSETRFPLHLCGLTRGRAHAGAFVGRR